MENILEKYILFTDLANYTLKTSLLTPKQLKEFIIDKQDEIILPLIEKFNGELIKYIGDSYLIIFSKANESVKFAIELQKKLQIYNKTVNLNLKKIELKIAISFGNILRKKTKIGYDYFGDAINIASRILENTPKNSIFITKEVYDNISLKNINFKKLGNFEFKGLIYKISLYKIDLGIDNNILLGKEYDRIEDIFKDIDLIIFKVSSVAFLLTIQPLPLLDNYFLALLHLYLLKQVALKYDIILDDKKIKEIISTIFLSIGGIYSVNQVLTGVSKIGLPVLGGYLFAPSNFALTYGLGKVFSNYFYYEFEKVKLTNENIKEIFLGTKDAGLNIAKTKKDNILKTGKKYKEKIIEELKNIKDEYKKILKKNIKTSKK